MLIKFNQAWIILGLLLIMAELFVGVDTGFDLMVIGTIFIFGGFAGLIVNNIYVTLILSTLLSLVYFFFLRKLVKAKIVIPLEASFGVDQLIGKTAIVTSSIAPHKAGKVKVNNEEWRAVSTSKFNQGSKVMVKKISGITLTVAKVKK